MSRHRDVFLSAYPEPPWICYFCDEPITILGRLTTSLVVHHIDHDRSHNDLENLAGAHNGCHGFYHRTGHVASSTTRALMSAARTGKKFTDETRAKMSASLTGRRFSAESRAKMSASAKARWARQ